MAREYIEGEKGMVNGVWSVYTPGGLWQPIEEKLPGGGVPPVVDIEREDNLVDLDPDTLDFIKDKGYAAPFATSTDLKEKIVSSLQQVAGGGLVTQRQADYTLTSNLRTKLGAEAPETLRAPTRDEFTNQPDYEAALRQFNQYGHWATIPATQLPLEEIEAQGKAKIRAGQGQIAQVQTAIQVETQEAQMENLLRPYDIAIGEARKNLETSLSRANAILTRSAGGLGLDTATQSAVADITGRGEANIAQLKTAREQARHNMRTEQLQGVSLMIERQEKAVNDILDKVWKQKIDLYNIQNDQVQQIRQMVQFQWDMVSKIPKGQSWTDMYGQEWFGIAEEEMDPFFTSGQWLDLIQSIPMGETQPIPLPDGSIMEVTGIGGPNLKTKVMTTKNTNTGEMTITTYNEETGEVINQVSAGKIGGGVLAPTSYREWSLAGGKEGTGKTYAEWAGTAKAEKPLLDEEDYRNLLAQDVPGDIVDTVMELMNQNEELDMIRTFLAEIYGQEKGFGYLDTVKEYLRKKALE